jgi:hypothetical protein
MSHREYKGSLKGGNGSNSNIPGLLGKVANVLETAILDAEMERLLPPLSRYSVAVLERHDQRRQRSFQPTRNAADR